MEHGEIQLAGSRRQLAAVGGWRQLAEVSIKTEVGGQKSENR
jgi:hypothetical protein